MADKYLDESGLSYFWSKLKLYFQEKLTSGVNIKTINSESLLGSGDIDISGWVSDVEVNGSSVVSGGVAGVTVPTDVSDLDNDAGYLSTESDPVFTASPAYGITQNDINAWDGLSNVSTESITESIGTTSATATAQKNNKVVTLPIVLSNSSGFSAFSSGLTLCTMPVGFRSTGERYGIIFARDNGVWASANYTIIGVQINSNGDIKLYGNETLIKSMKYINGMVTYIATQ